MPARAARNESAQELKEWRAKAKNVNRLLERYSPVLDELLKRAATQERRLAKVREAQQKWSQVTDLTDPKCLDLMAEWVRAEVGYYKAKGVIFGVSGGVDSTLVAVVAQRAVGKRARGFLMPQRNADPADEQDAIALMKTLGLPYTIFRMDEGIDGLLRSMGVDPAEAPKRHVGNMAQRARVALLYYQACMSGKIVLGSGDIDEVFIGYSSQGLASDLYPITGLHKDEVRALAYAGLAPLNKKLAEKLAFRPASPGYWPGHKSEDQIGLPYSRVGRVVDALMCCKADRSGIFPTNVDAFLDVLGQGKVSVKEALHVAELMVQNFSLVGGSPALFRPDNALALAKTAFAKAATPQEYRANMARSGKVARPKV